MCIIMSDIHIHIQLYICIYIYIYSHQAHIGEYRGTTEEHILNKITPRLEGCDIFDRWHNNTYIGLYNPITITQYNIKTNTSQTRRMLTMCLKYLE